MPKSTASAGPVGNTVAAVRTSTFGGPAGTEVRRPWPASPGVLTASKPAYRRGIEADPGYAAAGS